MITTSTKWFIGVGVFSLVLAAAYGYATGGTDLGPVTVGYWGGVGDHFGYGMLVATSALTIFLGLVATALRDGDAAAVAQVAGTETPPAVVPAGTSVWPIVIAFGVGLLAIGVVTHQTAFALGAVVLGIAIVEWAVRAWSDRATGDPATNREVRNRLMYPLEIPLGGLLAIGFVVISMSRLFLAVSSDGAWISAGVFATLVLVAGAVIANRPTLKADALAALIVVAALAVLAVGIAGLSAGEREFHPHTEEAEEHSE